MKRKRILFSLLCSALVFSLIISSSNGAELTDATVQSYEEQLEALQQKQKAAEEELETIRSAKSDTWTEMAKIDEIIEYNTQMKNLAESQIDTLDVKISETGDSIKNTEDKIDEQEQALLARMLDNYMDSETDYIEMLLSSKSLTEFLSRLERITTIINYDKSLLSSLAENREKLITDQESLESAETEQELKVAVYQNAISYNQTLYTEKIQEMKALTKSEEGWQEEYEENKALEDSLDAELQEYLEELQKKAQSVYVGGSGGWPLADDAIYYVSSEFGWRNLYGYRDYHLGIDLACAYGTNVCAYNSGTVLKSTYHYSYGNYIVIDHGGGISTLYAHLAEKYVSVGDYVTEGQIIGTVGLTGNTFGYHLHFETRENGTVKNPRDYLTFPK